MRALFLLVVISVLTGCVSSPVKLGEYSSTSNIESQKIGDVVTRTQGEVLAAKGERTTVPAIRIARTTSFGKGEGESSIMTCAISAMPGTYPQRGEFTGDPAGAECFGPVTIQATLADGSTNWNCPGQTGLGHVCRDASGNYFLTVNAIKAELKQQFDSVERLTITVEGEPNFVQELVYDGHSGDRINFTYREFTTDIARPTFAQVFQHDLAESRIFTFRSLRLEVIDISKESITYRLISGFDGS